VHRCQAAVRESGKENMEWKKSGGQGRNRTTDTRIFSPLLYRLSYLAPLAISDPIGNRITFLMLPMAETVSARKARHFTRNHLCPVNLDSLLKNRKARISGLFI
jgi:hypothetical protein